MRMYSASVGTISPSHTSSIRGRRVVRSIGRSLSPPEGRADKGSMRLVRSLRLPLVALLAAIAVDAGSAESADDAHWEYRTASIEGLYQPLVGDFAGDQGDDIFWYAPGEGVDVLWIAHAGARGSDSFTRVRFSVDGDYRPVVGDFVGDDYDDILWYRPGTTPDPIWASVPTDAVFERVDRMTVDGDYQ